MMPLENDELVERDFRYGMLLNQLPESVFAQPGFQPNALM